MMVPSRGARSSQESPGPTVLPQVTRTGVIKPYWKPFLNQIAFSRMLQVLSQRSALLCGFYRWRRSVCYFSLQKGKYHDGRMVDRHRRLVWSLHTWRRMVGLRVTQSCAMEQACHHHHYRNVKLAMDLWRLKHVRLRRLCRICHEAAVRCQTVRVLREGINRLALAAFTYVPQRRRQLRKASVLYMRRRLRQWVIYLINVQQSRLLRSTWESSRAAKSTTLEPNSSNNGSTTCRHRNLRLESRMKSEQFLERQLGVWQERCGGRKEVIACRSRDLSGVVLLKAGRYWD